MGYINGLLKLQETHENEDDTTQEAEELMMHEVVYLNKDNITPIKLETSVDGKNMVYLDNRASNHMNGNLSYFSRLDKKVTGKVKFGKESRIDIKGKGYILFLTKTGERKILNASTIYQTLEAILYLSVKQQKQGVMFV